MFFSRNPNASTTKEISISGKIYEKARLTMVTAFLELGFQQVAHRYDDVNFTHHYSLSPCPEGTYSLGSQGCRKCPPGTLHALDHVSSVPTLVQCLNHVCMAFGEGGGVGWGRGKQGWGSGESTCLLFLVARVRILDSVSYVG